MLNFNFFNGFFLGSVIMQELSAISCIDKLNFGLGWHTTVDKISYERLSHIRKTYLFHSGTTQHLILMTLVWF